MSECQGELCMHTDLTASMDAFATSTHSHEVMHLASDKYDGGERLSCCIYTVLGRQKHGTYRYAYDCL